MRYKPLKILLALTIIAVALARPRLANIAYAASKGKGPVAYWRFDEGGGATAYDEGWTDTDGDGVKDSGESWNNYDGTLTPGALGTNTAAGQMWSRQGKVGGALELDGTDDYVSSSSTGFNPTSSWTVEAWINADTFTLENGGDRQIVSQQDGTGMGRTLLLVANSNSKAATYIGAQYTYGPTVLSTNNWYHLATVYDSSTGQVAVYTNGIAGTPATITPEAATGGFVLGANKDTISGNWGGEVDDVRIYDYARSADQIMVDYNAGMAAHSGTGTDPNEGNPPAAYWTFDENTGQTAYDRSGSGNDGTLGSTSGSDTNDPTWTAGKYGSALSFDGTDDYVDMGQAILSTGSYSIGAWIKLDSYTGAQIYGQGTGTAYNVGDGNLVVRSDGTLRFRRYHTNGSASHINADGDQTVPLGAWTYVEVVYDSSTDTYTTSVNGVIGNTTATSSTGTIGGSENFIIGLADGSYFNGLIDEVKFYNYARTPAQIAYDYNKGKPVAHYKFDEGTGPIAHNKYSSADSGAAPFAWWRMDEATSGSANGTNNILDETGNGNHGSGNYGANATGMSWTSGKIGPGALDFDGADDYVDIPDYTPNYDSFTISAWFNLSSARSLSSDIDPIFGNYQNTPFLGYRPDIKTFYQLRQYSGGSQTLSWTSAANLADDAWHHVAEVVDQTNYTAELFLDGKSLGSVSIGTEGYTHSNGALAALGKDYASFFQGKIDDVRIYKYARTAEQIYNDYKNTHGTLVGDTKFVDGRIGKALSFDGTGDYVDCGNSSIFDITNAITLSAWVKVNPSAVTTGFVTKDDVGTNRSYNLHMSSAANYAARMRLIGLGGTDTVDGTTDLRDNAWHHVAGTWDGSTLRIYVDGIEENSVSGSGSINITSASVRIGDFDGGAYPMTGTIDDVRIYNYARTAAQIQQDYGRGFASTMGSQDGVADPWGGVLPVGHWKLDENTGILARDASGNGNDGTLGGDGAGTDVPTWTQGKVGPCLSFDGTDDYVDFGEGGGDFDFGTGDFTLEAWIKPTGAVDNNYYSLLEKKQGYNGTNIGFQWWLDYRQNGVIQVRINDGSTTNDLTPTATGNIKSSLLNSGWHHIASVVDLANNVTFYFDGINVGTVSISSMVGSINNDLNLTLVKQQPLAIDIDDVRIYNYARTQAQIAWDYNRGKPVAHWRMDEATSGAANGQTIYDDSVHNNDATANYGANATGMTWTTGKFGGALSFDGVDDKVSCGNGASLKFGSGDFTIAAWVKRTSASGAWEWLISKDASPDTSGWRFGINDTNKYIFRDRKANVDVAGATSFTQNAWQHVVATRSGTTLKIYLNGKEDGSGTISSDFDDTNNVLIGHLTSYPDTDVWTGLIDDVRIYNYARTAEQVMQDYNQGLAAKLSD